MADLTNLNTSNTPDLAVNSAVNADVERLFVCGSLAGDFVKTYNVSGEKTLEIYFINAHQGSEYIKYNTNLEVFLGEPNSTVKIYQIGIASEFSHINTQITVTHNAPNCTSEVISKYLLLDKKAQTNWQGNVIINQGAKGTTTFEENRNLLFASGAKADSEPNLEIFEGDIIEARHASSSTRPDDEELFYIMSRGISAENAKLLLKNAFINSVLELMTLSDSELTTSQNLLGLSDSELKSESEKE